MKAKGRAVGVPNYKNDVLINVVEAVLPDGALQWAIVAQRYQESSGERELRDSHDIKRHFTTHKNLCDNGKKVTGSSAPKPQVARCQDIWQKILRKSAASNCGGGSSSDEESYSEEEREVFNDENFEEENEENDQEGNNDGGEEYEEEPPEPSNERDGHQQFDAQRDVPQRFDAQRDVPPRLEAQRDALPRLEAQRLPIPLPKGPVARPLGHRAPSPLPRVPVAGPPHQEGKLPLLVITSFYSAMTYTLFHCVQSKL